MGNTQPAPVPQVDIPKPRIVSLARPHDEVVQTFNIKDGETLWIKCPNGLISTEIAKYGSLASNRLCYQEVTSLMSVYLQNGNELKVKVDPQYLGGDPCPGFPKTLQIQIRCRNWKL